MASKNLTVHDGPQPAVDMGAAFDTALETGNATELLTLLSSIPGTDSGTGTDAISGLAANVVGTDDGVGEDRSPVAKAFFFVDQHDVLLPLGVIVLRSSGREDLLPATRERTEEIPGRDGELDFGAEFQPRVIELHVATHMDRAARATLLRQFAAYLNPKAGPRPLIFAEDLERTYLVRYAGNVNLSQWPEYAEFTIPLKAADPVIVGSFENTATAGPLVNAGTVETPLCIEITGPVTNPTLTIGGMDIGYTGSLGSLDTLAIDSGTGTVKFNSENALASYSGGFPRLQPGATEATLPTGGTVLFRWRDRWI